MIKVVWSKKAEIELRKIIQFWDDKNGSTIYSKKLIFNIELAINLIKRNPNLGVKSNMQHVRMRLILKNYYLIYKVEKKQIYILRFWDNRQNPIRISLR